jgi:hypothetical protein
MKFYRKLAKGGKQNYNNLVRAQFFIVSHVVIPAKAGIQTLDHPVKSQRDPADRMMTKDGIAPEGTGSPLRGSQ